MRMEKFANAAKYQIDEKFQHHNLNPRMVNIKKVYIFEFIQMKDPKAEISFVL